MVIRIDDDNIRLIEGGKVIAADKGQQTYTYKCQLKNGSDHFHVNYLSGVFSFSRISEIPGEFRGSY
ncbi:MAG: hypothetical protein ACI87E_004457 [Mariniblastus sp.]|jgi:hypothetical protein